MDQVKHSRHSSRQTCSVAEDLLSRCLYKSQEGVLFKNNASFPTAWLAFADGLAHVIDTKSSS